MKRHRKGLWKDRIEWMRENLAFMPKRGRREIRSWIIWTQISLGAWLKDYPKKAKAKS